MKNSVRALISFAVLASATAAQAQVVTLKMHHTDVALIGQLVSEDGGNYVVKTKFGTAHVAKSTATCRGCTDPVVASAE